MKLNYKNAPCLLNLKISMAISTKNLFVSSSHTYVLDFHTDRTIGMFSVHSTFT